MNTAPRPDENNEENIGIITAPEPTESENETFQDTTTKEMYAIVTLVMAQRKMSMEKAFQLLMERNIDDLDHSHGPLYAAINDYCRDKCREDTAYEGILREAYNNLRLKLLRQIKPKEEPGLHVPSPIMNTIETIRHFIQGHD